LAPIVLSLHLLATVYMTGLVWFVQIVHYPSFALTEPRAFPRFAAAHTRRTGYVVAPAMLVEAATAAWLVLLPPEGISRALAGTGAALLAVIWLSTFLLQVPAHRRLAAQFDVSAHRTLVRSNWLRTVAWSVRAVLALAMAHAARVH